MNNPLLNPGIGLLFWMTLAFGILLFLLLKYAWPVILKMLNERETDIQNALSAAETARQEVEHLKEGNKELIQLAEKEREEMLRKTGIYVEKLISEAQIKAKAEADRILESSRAQIEYERKEAILELKNEIASLSLQIAAKVLNQELSDMQRANELIQKEISNINLPS